MADPKEQPAVKPSEAPAPGPQAAPVEQKPLPPDQKMIIDSVEKGVEARGAILDEATDTKAKMAAKSSLFKPEAPTVVPEAPKMAPQVTPQGTPIIGTQSETPGTKPPETSASSPPEKGITGIPTKAEIENMSMGELMTGMFESLGKIIGNFKGFFEGNVLGKLQQKVGEKFTDEEIKKIQVNFEKAKDTIYPTQDKSTEYVTSILNLPSRPDAQKFLNALQISGLVFQQDIGKLKELGVGDVLFFQKPEKKGVAYLTAVVSKTEPLTMRMIPRSGGAPQDIDLKQSDYFKNEWLGFVQLPRKQDQPPPPAFAKPEDKKDQKTDTPEIKPDEGSLTAASSPTTSPPSAT